MADHITTIREALTKCPAKHQTPDQVVACPACASHADAANAADAVERELADLRADRLSTLRAQVERLEAMDEFNTATMEEIATERDMAVTRAEDAERELADLRAENEAWKQRYRDEHEKKHSIWQKSTNEIFGLLEVMRKRTARAWRYRAERNDAERRLREATDAARDAGAGLRYIEERYGRLDGVGWDRVYAALAAVEGTAAAASQSDITPDIPCVKPGGKPEGTAATPGDENCPKCGYPLVGHSLRLCEPHLWVNVSADPRETTT